MPTPCRACAVLLEWVPSPVTPGARLPIELAPGYWAEDPQGPLKVLTDDRRIARVREPLPDDQVLVRGWILHWVTCSAAARRRFLRRLQRKRGR